MARASVVHPMKAARRDDDSRQARFALAGILMLTVLLGSRGITDEASVMLGGDMARYVMNGVFLHDLIADGGVSSFQALVDSAERYYARYPALSLGHHPPLPYATLVPFFWVFGVSLYAARAAALVWFVLGVWGLFAITRRLFNWEAATWTTAFFVTNVIVLRAGQYLLSEMPMITLVLWSVHALLGFCRTRRIWQLGLFVVLFLASLMAKQLAAFMVPVYGAIVINEFGLRILKTRRGMIGLAIATAVLALIAIMTKYFSPASWNMMMFVVERLVTGRRRVPATNIVSTILTGHLSTVMLATVVIAGIVLAFRRRAELLVAVLWIVSVVGGTVVVSGPFEPVRYASGALPAYFLIVGGVPAAVSPGLLRHGARIVLAVLLGLQLWTVRNVYPSGAAGYETSVEHILPRLKEPAVLYDSAVDTGYFAFFMRKHDPGGHLVFRADKIFRDDRGAPDQNREDMVAELHRLGIRWIVVEDHPSPSVRWFHQELQTGRFALREQIPVVSTAAPGTSLLIYEYLDATPADLDTEIPFQLALGERGFTLRLGDLISHR